MLVTGREQVETKTCHKPTTWGEIQREKADDSEPFLPCKTTKPPKKSLTNLVDGTKMVYSFWFPYLTCLIWESYLINYTFQSHDPGIPSLTLHEYFTANVRKGVAR